MGDMVFLFKLHVLDINKATYQSKYIVSPKGYSQSMGWNVEVDMYW